MTRRTFGERFRLIRKYEVLTGNRQSIRDHMRKLQLRNNGSRKETHPDTREKA